MTRRMVSLAVVAGALLVACGGRTEGGSASGLSADEPIAELSDAELQQLCAWFADALGGSGRVYECGDVSVEVDASELDCALPPECTALVGDVEECAREQRAALEACALDDELPACTRLSELCHEMGEDLVGPENTSPSATCEPGSTAQCACSSGEIGVQVCNTQGTGWSVCDCASTDPGCYEGQTRACTCADGSSGQQFCGSYWGACSCEVIGTCNPQFCPSLPGGTPCCMTLNGPCGSDLGAGCVVYAP